MKKQFFIFLLMIWYLLFYVVKVTLWLPSLVLFFFNAQVKESMNNIMEVLKNEQF